MSLLDGSIRRRDFLKGGAAATAAVAAMGLIGCAPNGGSEAGAKETDADGMNPHVVESDTAILGDEGSWVTVECWANCGGRCVNKAFVKDGVVLRQKTNDDQEDTLETPQQRSCPRGHSLRQHVFNANRLKYPMKRKSWQPGGGENAHGDLRGEEGWERISWEEALGYVAEELKRVYADYGPRSVVCMGTEWQVLNLLGGRVEWNSTESYGNWYLAPIQMGTTVGNGFPDALLINDRLDMLNADTIVLYGINPAWHNGGNPSYYYRLAKENGTEFVFVGPDYNVSAAMLDARWIRVRPGTDTAFLLAVAYEMLRLDESGESVVDWDFLHTYCVGFDAESMPEDAALDENFREYVLGTYDGQPKTPEWAAEICGTPIEDITWYAQKVGKQDNVTLLHSYAPSRYKGTIDLPQLFMTVACMGGHLGRPGNACGSVFNTESANGGPRLVKLGNPSKSATVPNPLERPEICKPEIWRSLDEGVYYNRGGYRKGPIDNNFLPQEEIRFDPKIIVNDFHNPLQATEDINRGIKVFKKMDMVVDVHYRYTLTSQYADILLPCTTPWEGNLDKNKGELDVATTSTMRLSRFQCSRDMILVTQPIIAPMYEAKNETWIFSELAKLLDLDPSELYPISDIQSYYDKIAGAEVIDVDGVTYKTLVTITQDDIDAWDVEGEPQEGVISLQDLLKQGMYIVPREQGDNLGYIGYKDFIDDPEANPRGSASGKMEIYCQAKADSINGIGYAQEELKPYPTYHPSTYENSFSNWEAKESGTYPFLMYQPHYLRRAHTNYDENVWTQEAFQNPVFISAEDAAAKGIETGDTVLVFNDAGKVLRQASVTNLIMPGGIAMPHGPRTYLDPETGIDFGGNENMLVDANTQDEFFPHMNGYNSCLVDFEKYDGEPLPADCMREPVLWTEE